MPNIKDQLIKHEGIRLDLYPDSVGKMTIGVGRNIVIREYQKMKPYLCLIMISEKLRNKSIISGGLIR